MAVFKHLLNLPTPVGIRYYWNFGSLLGFVLVVQLVSGIFLSFAYTADSNLRFLSVDLLTRDILGGDMVRKLHAKGASLFFLFLYLHTGRGIYFKSYSHNLHVWSIGLTILVLRMAIAFLGYVLPWGQMSYWGATVITNLVSVVPLVGQTLVEWLWGGFSVNTATITRFLGLHIILPLVLSAIVGLHIIFLHNSGSSNPVGVKGAYGSFFPYWVVKDVFGILAVVILFSFIVCQTPFVFMDRENFLEANFMVTPVHIQPEWYFLPAYAVLRSIPKKLGGVIGLLMVYVVFYIKPFFPMWPSNKFLFWSFIGIVLVLLWIGACVVEFPYIAIGQIFTFLYFFIVVFI